MSHHAVNVCAGSLRELNVFSIRAKEFKVWT